MSLERSKTRSSLHSCARLQLSRITNQHPLGSRYTSAKRREDEPQIPSPSLFHFSSAASASDMPPVAACAAHLELLECFYVMRQRIIMSAAMDEAFNIVPQRETKTSGSNTKTLKDAKLLEKRQIKWPRYVQVAAARFLLWMALLDKHQIKTTKGEGGGGLSTTPRHLPPLDVLMVWHSFMLNPRLYRDMCQNHAIYKLRMPWRAVHQAIDNRTWRLDAGAEADAAFESLTDLPASLFTQLETEDQAHLRMPTRQQLDDHYADPGPLVVQLKDAVLRQAVFVDKMSGRMWIRSPALEGTIRRATDRYAAFLALMRMHPGETMVPTLDIDLVWHTHQCAPGAYGRSTKAVVGRFVNHDDTMAEDKLGTGFSRTGALYKVHFGREYRVCGCWDCEAMLSAVEDAEAAGASADVDDGLVRDMAARVADEVDYHRAVEAAIRGKRPLPVKTKGRRAEG